MLTIALVVGIIWAYVFCGCIAYRLTINYGQKHGWGKSDMDFSPFMTGIFWPIALGFWAAWLPARTIMRDTNKMVGFIFSAPEKISARRNKVNLPIARVVK